MIGIGFRPEVMEQILLRESRFAEGAYVFIMAALELHQSKLEFKRHVTAEELSLACRDLAIKKYGVMAKVVLNRWGLHTTSDLGDVVFTLVDLNYLSSLPTDNRSQFNDIYDFDEVFNINYPWTRIAAL